MPNENVNKVILGTETLLDLTEDTVQAADVAAGKSFHLASGARTTGTASYAGAPTNNGNANAANAILYGAVDSTSTATAYTATIAGLDQLVDGTCVMLHNGVVTSAAGFTVNINELGAKKCYNNMTNATQDTTIFNVAYTMMFVYASDLDEGNGGWWIYRGYDGNTNTIGYQLRTNSTAMTTAIRSRYYRLFFTSADGTKWEPANTGYDNSATSAKTVNTRPIDPFGRIVYTSANTNYTAGATVAAATIWDRYAINLGYSFNRTGAALTMTFPAPVYVKCAPQADGSAIIDSTTPTVQALPSTNDGKIYIYLGMAYSATNIELVDWHPVYWHDGTGIRIWTGAEPSGGSTVTVTQSLTSGTQVGSISVDGNATALYAPTPPTASTTAPSMDGTASYGSGTSYARSNHVHPTDTSRQATLVSGTNIKTVNNESLLGSGNISVGGATYSTVAVQIATSAWSGTTATVNVTGVTASNDVIVAPAPASTSAWASAGIYCSAQGAGTLTFTCSTAPSEAVTANVMVFEGGEAVLPTYALSYTDSDSMTDVFSLSSTLENPINSASSGDTIYFGAGRNSVKTATVTAKRTDTQASVTMTYVSTGEYYIYSFTMPDAPVHVTVTWANPPK